MNDRDCESCKKFSRGDPHESEGYCEAKRTWVDPQEGEDCKMYEFTLSSTNKYKDGTPIYAEPTGLTIGALSDVLVQHTAKQKELSNQLDSLEQRIDELSEEYDAVLKTHGDTLEQHMERISDLDTVLATHAGKINKHEDTLEELKNQIEDIHKEYDMIFENHAKRINMISDYLEEHLDRICDLEHMYEKVLDDLCVMRDRLCKITDLLVMQDEYSHIFSNFCGNCIHAEMEDGLCTCALTGEALDPDYASCSRFDPSFTHVGDRPDWMEKIRKDMTTPSEPTEGCKDCKCAIDGMCVKYNCSLGAICATPECHEPTPF